MSGIFRNTSNPNPNPNSNESLTPNKRFSFGAFCTSPGTLQDVTMDNSYGVGYRSPCVSLQQYAGSTSPAAQGRSVREFEEQMASLRKENFNLKLRLYFIEESIPGCQQGGSADGQETLLKQLIDTKVEMEILRKEIQEKQEILKEAAQAMNQMEKIQKETEARGQAVADELRQRIQYLEKERGLEKSHSNSELLNDLLGRPEMPDLNLSALQKVRELEGAVKQSEEKVADLQSQIDKLDQLLAKRDETIREYEDKVKELVFQNAELLEAIELKDKALSNTETQRLRDELQEYKAELADKSCMLQEAEERLKSREQIHEQARLTIQKLMLSIKNQQTEISRLKNRNRDPMSTSPGPTPAPKEVSGGSTGLSSGLEYTGLCRSLSDSEALNDLTSSQRQRLETVLEQQEATIRGLKAEVKKKTANLQNLVNKELWEKNREIERLTKLVGKGGAHPGPVSPSANNESAESGGGELQQSFSDVEYARALERNKLLQRKVDLLIQRLGAQQSNEALLAQLRGDLQQARAEADSAEKWRRECADVCAVLSNRLEELAGFLNSLLKHKDVLGVLAADRRRAMRKAVDRSLDLSKSLNMTLSVSGYSMGDQSLGHLSNLSDILGEVEGLESRTFNSHEELRAQQSIETLKAENKALKKELDRRRSADPKRERRSLPVALAENQSESEAWSEPDRKVSLARIGLEEHSGSLLAKEVASAPHADADTDSESEAQRLDGRPPKTRAQDRIEQLEQIIVQRDERILEIQCQLVDADNRLKKENLRVLEMAQEMENLRLRNEKLQARAVAGDTPSQELTNNELLLKRQIDEKSAALEKLQEERDRLVVEARLAEMHIAGLKADLQDGREQHERELALAVEQEQQRLAELRSDMDALMQQRLDEQAEKHQEELERDWVALPRYEECKQQLSDLQHQYAEAQRSIENLQENEQELKQTLVECEVGARSLQKQLDESTLQASKAVMERTKALNEKLQLEKRVQELGQQLHAHETERSSLQQQIAQLEELQRSLKERIVRSANAATMTSDADAVAAGATAAASAAASAGGVNASDEGVSPSGYTSEEVMPARKEKKAKGEGLRAQRRMGEQRLQNSSPDLGIESDAGRVSSVELSNTQRPLLKTVELAKATVSANIEEEHIDEALENIKPMNSASGEQAAQQLENAWKSHDCAKVEQENAELRRKLIRTKRAFEDTYEKLRVANQRKAQIEKDIKNQILKTHNVLRNVRSNMENEL